MLTPGRRRRRRREPIIAATLLVLAVGVVVAIVLRSTSGSAPPTHPRTTTRPPVVHRPPPRHHAVVDTFVWPFYGYDAARNRSFGGSIGLRPPLHRGWTFHDFELLEFPPVIYHDRLLFVDYTGLAKAVNKINGRRLWKRKVGTLAAASPAVDPRRGLVFIPLMSTTRGARVAGNGRLVALSTKNGRTVWSRYIPSGSESSPVVHGQSVYVGSQDGTVYSFGRRDGHVNWAFHAAGAVKGGVAYSGGVLFFGDYAGQVYAVNAGNGHEIWATSVGGRFYGSAAVAFGHVFLGNTDSDVYAFSKTGRELWSTGTGAYVYGSPAAANPPGVGPTVFVGSYDGNFYALNANTGAVRWRHASGDPISGSGTVIGHVIYYSVLHVKDTIGLSTITGRQVLQFPDGAFAAAVADHKAIYLIGYSTIYQMLPQHRK